MTRLTAHDAIEYAAAHGLTLSKYADPTEGARGGLTVEEAREIAADDPSLIYVAVAYGIQIQTGTGPYRWLSGWDATYPTMREAQEAQSRANAQEGWSARIVVLNTEAE